MENKHNLTAWYVETDAQRLRRLGKTLEELGELQAVVARCIIQGVGEVDPSSGKINRLRLQEEIADVYAQLELLIDSFQLDMGFIYERVNDKEDQMHTWDALVQQERLVEEDARIVSDEEWYYSGD